MHKYSFIPVFAVLFLSLFLWVNRTQELAQNVSQNLVSSLSQNPSQNSLKISTDEPSGGPTRTTAGATQIEKFKVIPSGSSNDNIGHSRTHIESLQSPLEFEPIH